MTLYCHFVTTSLSFTPFMVNQQCHQSQSLTNSVRKTCLPSFTTCHLLYHVLGVSNQAFSGCTDFPGNLSLFNLVHNPVEIWCQFLMEFFLLVTGWGLVLVVDDLQTVKPSVNGPPKDVVDDTHRKRICYKLWNLTMLATQGCGYPRRIVCKILLCELNSECGCVQ